MAKFASKDTAKRSVIYSWWYSPKQNISGVVECFNDGSVQYVDLRKMMEETGRPTSWYLDQLEKAALSKVRPICLRIEVRFICSLNLAANVHAAIGLLNEERIFNADSHLITPELEGAVEYVNEQIKVALAASVLRKES